MNWPSQLPIKISIIALTHQGPKIHRFIAWIYDFAIFKTANCSSKTQQCHLRRISLFLTRLHNRYQLIDHFQPQIVNRNRFLLCRGNNYDGDVETWLRPSSCRNLCIALAGVMRIYLLWRRNYTSYINASMLYLSRNRSSCVHRRALKNLNLSKLRLSLSGSTTGEP